MAIVRGIFLLGRVSGIAITGSRPAKLASVIGGFNYRVIARGVSGWNPLRFPPYYYYDHSFPPCAGTSFLRLRTEPFQLVFSLFLSLSFLRANHWKINFHCVYLHHAKSWQISNEAKYFVAARINRGTLISLKLRPERTERCRNAPRSGNRCAKLDAVLDETTSIFVIPRLLAWRVIARVHREWSYRSHRLQSPRSSYLSPSLSFVGVTSMQRKF